LYCYSSHYKGYKVRSQIGILTVHLNELEKKKSK